MDKPHDRCQLLFSALGMMCCCMQLQYQLSVLRNGRGVSHQYIGAYEGSGLRRRHAYFPIVQLTLTSNS
jgi:hypothetical protein